MNYLADSRLIARLRVTSLAAAALSAAVGAFELAAWLVQLPALKSVLAGVSSIEPNTACCLALLGVSLWLRAWRGSPRGGLPMILALLAAVLGALSLVDRLFGWNSGVDQLFLVVAHPVIQSPITAISVVFLGSALVLCNRAEGRLGALVRVLPYATGILSIFGVLDFFLEPGALHAHMALENALALLALSCGAIAMSPDRGLAALLCSTSSGGVLARRLLPAAVAAPIVLGRLFWSGFQAGLFLPWTGIGLMIITAIALFAGLTAWTAFAIHRIEHQTAEQRQRSEEALRRSEKHFSAMVERASDVVTVIDDRGATLYESPSVERVIGWTPAELIGRNAFDLVHPKDREALLRIFREKISDFGATVAVTYRVRHKDGSWRSVESIACNLRNDPDINGVVVNTRDVTERNVLEARFLQAQKMEVAGQLAGGIAHDFNNVLAVILLQTELIKGEPGLSPAVRQSLHDMQDAVQHAKGLVRQLLVFSRREALQLRPLDLKEVLSNIVPMLRKFLGEQIRLDLQLGKDSAWIEADTGMIGQVVMNLCVNARDAMPRGGALTIRAEAVDVDQASVKEQARAGRYVRMTVADTGHGMDEATLKRIFEPFFTTKEIGKGTGLGLSTVFGIVKQHNGWIEVASAVGRGSTFSIFLPAAKPLVAPFAAAQESGSPGGTETILLVEDEAAIRKVAALLLRRSGYEVIEAANGIEALQRWDERRGRVDLLLTDMVMPERMTGLEVAESLQKRKAGLKVIIFSGYSVDAEKLRAVNAQGIVYLAKPVMPDALLAAIRRCLDNK